MGFAELECKTCKKYEGNCGNHFIDPFKHHINYEIPAEGACDQCGDCRYYERKSRYKIALQMMDEGKFDQIDRSVIHLALECALREEEKNEDQETRG